MTAAMISANTAPLTPMLICSNRLPSLSELGVGELTAGDAYNTVFSVGTVEVTVGELRCKIVGKVEGDALVVGACVVE